MDKIAKKFSIGYGINMLGLSLINGILVLFLSSKKGYTSEQISLLLGIIPLISMPSIFIWGRILDKKKQLMKWLTILNVVNGILIIAFIYVQNYYLFFALFLIRNIAIQPTGSTAEEYILNLSIKSEIPYGKIRVWGTIGYGLAGILSPFIIIYTSTIGVLVAGIMIVAVSVLIYLFLPEIHLDEKSDSLKNNKINWSIFKRKEFLSMLFITGVLFGTLNAASSYGAQIILIELKCPEAYIGFLPFIMVVFETIFLLIIHRFKVQEKPYTILAIAMIILSVRWFVTAQATHYNTIIISTILHGIVVGMGLPAQNYIIKDITTIHERSSAMLIAMTINSAIIPSIINLITGQLLGKTGINIFGYTYFTLCVLTFVVLIKYVKKEMNLKKINS